MLTETSLSQITISGFERLNWGSIFKRIIIQIECNERPSFFVTIIKFFFLPLMVFVQRFGYTFENNNNSKILFFHSYMERLSMRKFVRDIYETTCADILYGSDRIEYKFRIKEGVEIAPLVPRWFVELRKSGLSFSEMILIIYQLVELYRLKYFLSNIEINKYNLLVTYCDSYIMDAYVTEVFKKRKIKTASLEHGQYNIQLSNRFIDSGVEFRTFKSDYLLCWNKYTLDLARKQGISDERLVLCGVGGFIKRRREKCIKCNNGIFGVVLSHPSFEDENIAMINAANFLYKEMGLRYYLKLHPNYKENYFSNIVNEGYLGNIKKGIPILEYANSVDFSIVGSSTVFVELVYCDHSIIKYSSGNINDKFKCLPVGNSFQNTDELLSIVHQKKYNDSNEDLFDYLCSVEDVAKGYGSFFNQFV